MILIIISAAVLIPAVPAAVLPWSKLDMAKTENVLNYEPLVGLELVWSTFKMEYNKKYAHATEDLVRKQIFSDNLKEIEMHNYLYAKGLKSYTMGVNRFTDMTADEAIKLMTGLRIPEVAESTASTYMSPNVNFTLPAEVDWRQKGYVNRVKDQGQCGSCWAFSAVGALEGQHFRKTGKFISLSEQNLVDCDTKSQGCEGGLMDGAFDYVKKNDGIDTEESYPYEGKNSKCRYDPKNKGATVTGYVKLPGYEDSPNDAEQKLAEAIATIGPISVAIEVQKSFMSYKSGIYDEASCTNKLNHGVLAVGYGTLNGQDYYIIKNSWAEAWGDKGYILMSRNKKNQCGISSSASYPLM